MKAMKKLLEVVLLIIGAFALMAACSEYPEHQFPWSMGWMSVLAICAHILDRMGCIEKEGK